MNKKDLNLMKKFKTTYIISNSMSLYHTINNVLLYPMIIMYGRPFCHTIKKYGKLFYHTINLVQHAVVSYNLKILQVVL